MLKYVLHLPVVPDFMSSIMDRIMCPPCTIEKSKRSMDEDLTQATVSSISTLRVILSLALDQNLKIIQIHVSTAFFNSRLDDAVYISPPPGFEHLISKGKYIKMLT